MCRRKATRIGVERRVYASSEHKAGLDPFRFERLDEVEHLRSVQGDIYAAFCAQVRARRGDRLRGDEAELFSGRFWSGRKALELGLIDGIGDLRTVMRGRFGDKVKLRVVGGRQPWWRRRIGLATGQGSRWAGSNAAAVAGELLGAVEAKAGRADAVAAQRAVGGELSAA